MYGYKPYVLLGYDQIRSRTLHNGCDLSRECDSLENVASLGDNLMQHGGAAAKSKLDIRRVIPLIAPDWLHTTVSDGPSILSMIACGFFNTLAVGADKAEKLYRLEETRREQCVL
jgi:hypothetical protein